MSGYLISVSLVGFVALCISWIKHLTKLMNISYSLVLLIMGVFFFWLFEELPWSLPQYSQTLTMHLTEIMVIIAVMGTGLKIDSPFSFKAWSVPFRLVTITMMLSILLTFGLGYWGLGWGLASSLLLAASLAPTDPVLAAEVQVGPPNDTKDHNIKFALTAEAGLNDGMAFPFTWLAIIFAWGTQFSDPWVGKWVWYYVVYKIAAGCLIGFLIGKIVTHFFFRLPEKLNLPHIQEGLVAIAATLFVYGITELASGYGFIAVFVTAITIRNYEMNHEFHKTLHLFLDQVEHILLAVLLLLFGGSLVDGILDYLTWKSAVIGLFFLFCVRPLSTVLGLFKSQLSLKNKTIISFFGIRGVGSFFYLLFAFEEADFFYKDALLSLVAFVVLVSIIIHGLSAPYFMKGLDSRD